MNIVTIMNYDWSNTYHIKLCSLWINQAKTWLTKFDSVYIYSEQKLHKDIIELMRYSDTCSFKSVISNKYTPDTSIHFGITNEEIFSNHNFLFKLYITTNINFPYLFLDCDAFIVDSINNLNDIFIDTSDSVYFIDHETNIPKETEYFEPFINSGVFLMNDPEHLIYNWSQILKFAKSKNFTCKFNNLKIIIPGSDQAIIKSYFDYIDYDYHHKNFGIEYNTSSLMINRWFEDSNKRLQTTLKNNPNQICKIVHYWGKNKLWENDICPLIKEV
jgi:hypothetical protein